ncbi:MAG TPA: N-acetyl-gamma-glutamyl-phosphate reductase, partial [Myxococcales bacterium]|nr:N-acetyl-gamma-glutamyl-phosphate reductase [Myxococcales bacterium]
MDSKKTRVSVLGGTGYGGAELLRHLLFHPHVDVVKVGAADHIGARVADVHQTLFGRTDLVFEQMTPTEAAEDVDLVFLGVPHRVSATLVKEIMATDAKIIDLSGDFRLLDADVYARYYHGEHPHPEILGRFTYGLPECNREAIKNAQYVASPGCFATCIVMALLPAARAGMLNNQRVRVVAMTGSSGSGQTPRIGTHHPLRSTNLKAYRPLDHQHMPEIVQTLELAGASNFKLDFVPVSAPLQRGILALAFIDVDAEFTTARAQTVTAQNYENEAFIRVLESRLPEVNAVKGSMFVEVGGHVEDGTWVSMSALDNLVKGG